MGFFRFLARMTVGMLFFAHGAQKLFGWFGGHGLDATAQGFESMGLRPGRRNAMMAGAAETAGGLMFATGTATPVAAAALSGTMISAIKTVHWDNGVWNTRGGYEYNLVLLAAVFGLTENGPGRWSVDAHRGRERWGTGWALAALAPGAAGAAKTIAAAEQGLAGAQAAEAEQQQRHEAEAEAPVPAMT